jgi:hypothetical protein
MINYITIIMGREWGSGKSGVCVYMVLIENSCGALGVLHASFQGLGNHGYCFVVDGAQICIGSLPSCFPCMEIFMTFCGAL